MTIYMYDGSILECTDIEIGLVSGVLICDGYRCIDMEEVVTITDGFKEG